MLNSPLVEFGTQLRGCRASPCSAVRGEAGGTVLLRNRQGPKFEESLHRPRASGYRPPTTMEPPQRGRTLNRGVQP